MPNQPSVENCTSEFLCLDEYKTLCTIEKLQQRIRARFPQSSLADVRAELETSTRATRQHLAWIKKPLIWLRVVTAVIIILSLSALLASLFVSDMNVQNVTVLDLLTAFEAGINNLLLAGAAIFFLITIEQRIKRARAQKALHELRALAHVIDMHQLTKNTSRIKDIGEPTSVSEQKMLTVQQLTQYLDYCSEMLALVGKVSALYAQYLPDPEIISTVNEIESLTTGLSRKIWQKITTIEHVHMRHQAMCS